MTFIKIGNLIINTAHVEGVEIGEDDVTVYSHEPNQSFWLFDGEDAQAIITYFDMTALDLVAMYHRHQQEEILMGTQEDIL